MYHYLLACFDEVSVFSSNTDPLVKLRVRNNKWWYYQSQCLCACGGTWVGSVESILRGY